MFLKSPRIFFKFISILVLSVLSHVTVYSQTALEEYTPFGEVEKFMYSNPELSLKVAQHLLTQSDLSEKERARIVFLKAVAFKTKGNYGNAIKCLYEIKNPENYFDELGLINLKIEKYLIFDELLLNKQADEILVDLEISLHNTKDDNLRKYLDTFISISKTEELLNKKKFSEGIRLLENLKLNSSGVFLKFPWLQIHCSEKLASFYFVSSNLDKARAENNYLITLLNKQRYVNRYSKILVLEDLAVISLLEKKHNEATMLLKQALTESEKIGNIYLKVKALSRLNANYLASRNVQDYSENNKILVEMNSQMELSEQESLNTIFNVLSGTYSSQYRNQKATLLNMLYGIISLYILVGFGCFFYWLRISQRKEKVEEVLKYIDITSRNLLEISIVEKSPIKKNIILKETEEEILKKLKRFENSKKFTNKDMSLAVLAGQFDTNIKYLSEVINTHYQMNFNMYINTLRINYIVEKLKTEPNFSNYKISYLADYAGFASHSSFATVFKSITGISPIKFIDLLKNEKENLPINDAI